jgi:mono/diheme cytochrome c family protein
MHFKHTIFLMPALLLAGTSFAADYTTDVKPLLAKHCIECHGPKVQKAKLRLDTAEFLRKGGAGGTILVPGKSADSVLIQAVKGTDGVTLMPYKRPALKDEQIRLLAEWIDQGAKSPAGEKADDGSGRNHWAFQRPVRPELPALKDVSSVRNPIDRFILARLEKAKIRPAAEADRVTLMRRVYLDLLGLPPSLEEVEAYLADTRADAYERLVDKLLESPHHGERWARHWLDLARYADSDGFSIDAPREIWKYRDWVVDALNKNLPFDQFVIEQMAGDMLPQATLEQKIATGFHRNTLVNQEGGVDQEQFRVEAVADRVNTTGAAFLGLTLGCARCHDHKFDPISQREYFQLFAFLNNQSEPTLPLADPAIVARRETFLAESRKLEEELERRFADYFKMLPEAKKTKADLDIQSILNLGTAQRSSKQRQEVASYFSKNVPDVKKDVDRLTALRKQEPKFPTTLVLQELPKPRITAIHIAGDFTRKGDKVLPDVPGVLHPLPAVKGRGLNRLDLARWLVDRRNPLTARVTMNRLWQQYFGKGLVETENDFGLQGSPPSHPELLDWLAVEFMESTVVEAARLSEEAGGPPAPRAWDMRTMHRLIVTSATYRQSSRSRPDLAVVDPYNRLLARQSRLRLDAEVIRDNALAVSGLLSRKQGGPSVYPPQPGGVYQFTQVPRTWPTSKGGDEYRRGLYTFFQRSAPYPALTVFDAPDGVTACTRRIRSNTPLQALTLLNDPAYVDLARGLAARVLENGPADDSGRLNYVFRVCLARTPSSRETSRLEKFLVQQKEEFAAMDAAALVGQEKTGERLTELAAWTSLTRVLLNLDEFITRE